MDFITTTEGSREGRIMKVANSRHELNELVFDLAVDLLLASTKGTDVFVVGNGCDDDVALDTRRCRHGKGESASLRKSQIPSSARLDATLHFGAVLFTSSTLLSMTARVATCGATTFETQELSKVGSVPFVVIGADSTTCAPL